MKDYETLRHDVVYRGHIIDVAVDAIRLPNGREAKREVVLRGGAAAVVPVDRDGKIIFVRQYRHPARALTLEIPAGMLEEGEEAVTCAERELEEETGMKAGKVTFLFQFYAAIGFCTEVLHLYLAEELAEGVQHLDEEEFVTLEKYTPEEAVEMIRRGEIVDSKTIAGVLYVALKS